MQGYCWPLSGSPGQSIGFHMSTGAHTYTVSYVRFYNRWNATAADIQASMECSEIVMAPPFEVMGQQRDTSFTSDVGCGAWPDDFVLSIPDWPSGIYAARCEDDLGSLFYVTFIISPPREDRGSLAVIANTTTWNAYNNWGGYSRYEVPTNGDYEISFLRPNPQACPVNIDDAPFNADIAIKAKNLGAIVADLASNVHSRHLARAEMWVINWLTGKGYRPDVYSDLDLHQGIDNLEDYRALLLNTHPEYWSLEMVDQLCNYLNQGRRLVYLGGNAIFDAVTFSPGETTVMTVHGGVHNTGNVRTRLFRNPPISRPEGTVLGVQYDEQQPQPYVEYEVQPTGALHRFFRNTGLAASTGFGARGWNIPVGATDLTAGGASGWEVDTLSAASPSEHELLAIGRNAPAFPGANMVYYEHAAGGFVFSAGSMTFGGSLVVDDKIQTIVANAIDEAIVVGNWPGLWTADIDAAVNWGNGKVYFFKGGEYIRYNIKADVSDAGYPSPISGNWPGLWTDNIDAIVNWGNGKVYFFRGSEYCRYDIEQDSVDPGYPRTIAGNWPGLWSSGIDAAVAWHDGRVYFFKGSEYVRYNMDVDAVDVGYPCEIAGAWPGIWTSDIDAIVNWGNGKVFFFKGDKYIRYDVALDRADEGYPQPITA